MTYKIYLAGPVFSMAERRFNEHLAEEMTMLGGVRSFLPQSIDYRSKESDVFRQCLHNIDECDIVVANIDGPDADSGTAFEMGYAYRIGKPIIALRTDFRASGDTGRGNIMLINGAAQIIECYERFFDIRRLAKEVHEAVLAVLHLGAR